jgi:hypothetical protein
MAKGRKTGGRRPGSPNKVTTEFRETVRRLLEENAENIIQWVGEIAKESPEKAVRAITDLAEFAAPKLSRTELTGKDGERLQLVQAAPGDDRL